MHDAPIISDSARVDELLVRFKDQIGADFAAYRGHVLRVLTHAMAFLNGKSEHQPLIETALVYHDIGLWTAQDLAYLEPSEEMVVRHNTEQGWGFDPDLLVAIIHWHHKITPYKGPNAEIVNAVRKADWIEASQGMIRKGVSRARLQAVHTAIPDHGFGDVLQNLAKTLGGSAIKGNLRVLARVFKW
ncbi:MAG: HD domain-containing protein [Pseudomonadota bacterium]